MKIENTKGLHKLPIKSDLNEVEGSLCWCYRLNFLMCKPSWGRYYYQRPPWGHMAKNADEKFCHSKWRMQRKLSKKHLNSIKLDIILSRTFHKNILCWNNKTRGKDILERLGTELFFYDSNFPAIFLINVPHGEKRRKFQFIKNSCKSESF